MVPTITVVSWPEAFAERYEEWSAAMTADIPFYVRLARETEDAVIELGVGNGRVAVPVAEAIGCAKKILELPQQAVESTKRVLNIHLERAVLASLDYALSAESLSLQTEDFRSIVTKLAAGKN